jgi:diguanylate cyclase (GGDEF)-like protein
LVDWSGDRWDPVNAGRLLLLVTGLVTSVTAPLLHLNRADWQVLLAVGVVMIGILATSYVIPWTRMPRRATVLFPLSVWIALAVLGLAAHGLGSNFTGLTAIGFAYLGLTQSTTTCLTMIPPAVVTFLGAYDGWSSALVSRLPLAIIVWALLAVLVAELIAHQQALTEQLRTAANTDVLTGVANRRDLEHRLLKVTDGDALVLCDLDNFKHLNDTLGHAAGDRVLADFGLVLSNSLRESDYAARYGGEEFALILPCTNPVEAQAALTRVRQQWSAMQHTVTFSAGVAMHHGANTAETLEAADQALYLAKNNGRNRDVLSAH